MFADTASDIEQIIIARLADSSDDDAPSTLDRLRGVRYHTGVVASAAAEPTDHLFDPETSATLAWIRAVDETLQNPADVEFEGAVRAAIAFLAVRALLVEAAVSARLSPPSRAPAEVQALEQTVSGMKDSSVFEEGISFFVENVAQGHEDWLREVLFGFERDLHDDESE